jgi:hypothetical protein
VSLLESPAVVRVYVLARLDPFQCAVAKTPRSTYLCVLCVCARALALQIADLELHFAVVDGHHNTVSRAVTIYLLFLSKRTSPVALKFLANVTMRLLLFAGYLTYPSTLKTEAVHSSEMLGNFYRITRRQVKS